MLTHRGFAWHLPDDWDISCVCRPLGKCLPRRSLTVLGLFALLLVDGSAGWTDVHCTGLLRGSRGVAYVISSLSSRGRTSSSPFFLLLAVHLLSLSTVGSSVLHRRRAKVEMSWERLGARQHSALPAPGLAGMASGRAGQVGPEHRHSPLGSCLRTYGFSHLGPS